MTDVYEDKLPHGWSGGAAITKWWRGKFVHLYRLQKPCGQCGTEMAIDVTREALRGEAKNSGLLLKRCAACRNASKADVGRSRPHVTGQPTRYVAPAEPSLVAENAELRKLIKEAEEAVADVAQQAGGVRKALHEQLGLSLMGDAISYDTVKAALLELKGEHELRSAVKQAAFQPVVQTVTVPNAFEPKKQAVQPASAGFKPPENKMPWQ